MSYDYKLKHIGGVIKTIEQLFIRVTQQEYIPTQNDIDLLISAHNTFPEYPHYEEYTTARDQYYQSKNTDPNKNTYKEKFERMKVDYNKHEELKHDIVLLISKFQQAV